ncbi:hypothetical protein ACG04Q_12390 [Roseateles sp. DXS20W]|uniref:Uncharacterized protein n=1 Tax=Pelomonas lactea TaxID=3299030 RepID=A0ABW7GK83_9BURK
MKSSRRRWLVWGGALALLLAGGGWLGRQGWLPGETAAGRAVAGAAPGHARLAADAPASAALRGKASPAGDSVAASAPAGTDDDAIPPEGLEVCGVRRVSADELRRWKADPARGRAEADKVSEQMQRVGDAALARLAARLAAGDERQQVAARLLMQDRDGAALLAARSSDALAYQMALTACGGPGGDTPHCARLTPQRWAALDPSDARPWLRLMAAAQQRQDAAGVAAALAEAAARPALSRGQFLLERQAVAVAGAVPDAAAIGNALVAIIGMDAAMPGFDLGAPLRACRGDALRDTTRLAQCRALARQVLANATDLGEATVAQELADRVGVPREQQAHDAATLKAAQDRYLERALTDIGSDCAAMQRLKRLSTERVATGELGMALSLLPAR